ncbi:hypothetical protein [Croceimicrobium hydrocarbonivorans]|uniref:Lipocalin-like domain-containing protein n=1 Tax=Croceimicrobium hydrocarbonivorans TaxID=2761580 RepID=A0A7H0VFR1_9FLAO|nr:hypothetical protein [Croceimicrobium hydrocarbonivorans]QNR24559.1 hypothetical protein H4K34_01580 [Croceimicrobium hydrocarbonivorans]
MIKNLPLMLLGLVMSITNACKEESKDSIVGTWAYSEFTPVDSNCESVDTDYPNLNYTFREDGSASLNVQDMLLEGKYEVDSVGLRLFDFNMEGEKLDREEFLKIHQLGSNKLEFSIDADCGQMLLIFERKD